MDFAEKYIRKKILGEGAQGEVWLVENRDTKAAAAMKLYHSGNAEMEREIQVLKDLGGKGIPYQIDLVQADGKSGIVMEYVAGKSLRTLLRGQRIWAEEEAVDMAVRIAGILHRFHSTSPVMIYGDLKPENIMVTPEGSVYLIDFGAVIYEGEREKKVFGTRDYLPPVREEKLTPYRDTYGLGVLLYEMLTGYRLPEGSANGKADISHLTLQCRQIMQKAVRIRMQEGYADAGQMLEDLKECQSQYQEQKKRRRKKYMKRKNKTGKRNYFICDLKRVSLCGRGKISGMICACLLTVGILLTGLLLPASQTLAAERREAPVQIMMEQEKTDREAATAENAAQASAEKSEPPRDEYGRKLVIRNQ